MAVGVCISIRRLCSPIKLAQTAGAGGGGRTCASELLRVPGVQVDGRGELGSGGAMALWFEDIVPVQILYGTHHAIFHHQDPGNNVLVSQRRAYPKRCEPRLACTAASRDLRPPCRSGEEAGGSAVVRATASPVDGSERSARSPPWSQREGWGSGGTYSMGWRADGVHSTCPCCFILRRPRSRAQPSKPALVLQPFLAARQDDGCSHASTAPSGIFHLTLGLRSSDRRAALP